MEEGALAELPIVFVEMGSLGGVLSRRTSGTSVAAKAEGRAAVARLLEDAET